MSTFSTRMLFATADGMAKLAGSELHVGDVEPFVPEHFEPTEIEPAQIERGAKTVLGEQAKMMENVGGTAQGHLRMGHAAERVVVGRRGRGTIRRLLMGSVSGSVVHHAHSSALVVREDREGTV